MGGPSKAMTVGERIAQARLNLGARRGKAVTQTEVARVVGVMPATVSQWESGTVTPALGTIPKIAEALGVSPGFLAFGEQTTTPHSGEQGDRYTADQWRDVTAEAEAALAAEEAEQASTTAPRKNVGRKR